MVAHADLFRWLVCVFVPTFFVLQSRGVPCVTSPRRFTYWVRLCRHIEIRKKHLLSVAPLIVKRSVE